MYSQMRILFLCALLQGASALLAGQGNPLFFIPDGGSKRAYEVKTDFLRNVCPQQFGLKRRPIWIYAHVREDGSDYLLVDEEGSSVADEYGWGQIIVIRDGRCLGIDTGFVLDAQPPTGGYSKQASNLEFPNAQSPRECYAIDKDCVTVFRSAQEEDLVRRFIRDGIRRAVQAYGSANSFRSVACTRKIRADLEEDGRLIVKQELAAYCSK